MSGGLHRGEARETGPPIFRSATPAQAWGGATQSMGGERAALPPAEAGMTQ